MQIEGLDRMLTAMRAASSLLNASGDLANAMAHDGPSAPLYKSAAFLASDDLFGYALFQEKWEYMGKAEKIDAMYDYILGMGEYPVSMGDEFIANADRVEDDIYDLGLTDPESAEDAEYTEALLEELATSADGYMKMIENTNRIYMAVDRARDIFVESGGDIR